MVTMSTATDLNDGRVGGMRVPPHNLQAEESLLGAMLLRSQAIADAVETVVASDFYKPAHGHIFEAITSLYGGGEPVDPVTVSEELKRAGLLSAIGGSGVLLTIQSRTPAVSNVALRGSSRRTRCSASSSPLRGRSPSSATHRSTTSPRPSISPKRWSSMSLSVASRTRWSSSGNFWT